MNLEFFLGPEAKWGATHCSTGLLIPGHKVSAQSLEDMRSVVNPTGARWEIFTATVAVGLSKDFSYK